MAAAPPDAVRVGSVCTGSGGLELALEAALGPVRIEWAADTDPAASRVLGARFPDSPNLGDITAVDWDGTAPVDAVCGGTPCQDLSRAGRGAGMTTASRSGLWAAMARAVEQTRPALVVWENVEGALHRGADSSMGPRGGDMAPRPTGPVLRAAGRVVGEMAGLGYDCQWAVVPAAGVGAPHRRKRLFVLGVRRGTPTAWLNGIAARCAAPDDPHSPTGHARTPRRPSGAHRGLTPAPGAARTLPTPTTQDVPYSSPGCGPTLTAALRSIDPAARPFGPYEDAVRHWEALTRPAPPPTEPSPRDRRPRLNAAFAEWMMGLPDGWVTSPELGLSRAQQLRLVGNAVCPPQAAEAVRHLLRRHLSAHRPTTTWNTTR